MHSINTTNMKDFWEDWIKADELERIKLIRTLPPFRRGGICRYATASLLNSYLVDLYNITKKETTPPEKDEK